MKAFDTRMRYEYDLYSVTCRKCKAEIEGEPNEFKLVSRFYATCTCPGCGGHNTFPVWKLRRKTVIGGIREIQKLEV